MVEIKFLKEAFDNFSVEKLPKEFFNNQKTTGLVYLWNLNPTTKLKITEDKGKELVRLSLIKSGFNSRTKLGMILNERIKQRHCPSIHAIEKGRLINLSLLIKLLYYLNDFSLFSDKDVKEITVKGVLKKRIFNPKLPFNFDTTDGARFLASILHDGCLLRNYVTYTKTKATTKEEALRMRKSFLDSAFNIFGEIESPKGGWNKALLKKSIILPAITARIVSLLIDEKIKKLGNANIPPFLFKSGEESRHVFLRRAFDDDGSIYFNPKKGGRTITLRLCNLQRGEENKPPILLSDDSKLLQVCGIKGIGPKLKEIRDKSTVWQIDIQGKKQLEKFNANIGFELEYKQKKLREALDSYQQEQFGNKRAEDEILKIAYTLELEKGFFTVPELSKKCRRSYGRTSVVISKLLKRKLVKKVTEMKYLGKGGKSSRKGSKAATYEITHRGRNQFRVVLTGGCFDILHVGHLATLKDASNLGDVLVVIIARDRTIKKLKNRESILPEEHRKLVVSSLKPVDIAILGHKKVDIVSTIKSVGPDIIALGKDQHTNENLLKKKLKNYKLNVKVIRLDTWIKNVKTSEIIKLLKNN